MQVLKRDGSTTQDFDVNKIVAAIRGAWVEVHGVADDLMIQRITLDVEVALDPRASSVYTVEQIQDAVEVALMRAQEYEVAKAFILFRQRRADDRAASRAPDPSAIAQYIEVSKYARHRPDLRRRETRDETVDRVRDMHLRRYGHLGIGFVDMVTRAFEDVRARKVMASMRSMQFGGTAMEAINERGYNCCATLMDRPRAFQELLYLLLCGCGTGYSVQFRHVDKLPALARQTGDTVHHVVQDTIEGWAEAWGALVMGAIDGTYVEFAYHKIRKKGALLKTSGGRAPGHVPLRRAIERARAVLLGAQGRQLRPIEVHRINCHAADAVLSGGIRRSAMISLFSLDDGEMMNCKVDADWYGREPWLSRANNSAVLLRGAVTEEQFRRVFKYTRAYGEPGFTFVSSYDHVTNPCAEIGLDPVYIQGSERSTGWAFCNLTSVNAAACRDGDDFLRAAESASIIGTLQAGYTSFPYLGSVSEAIAERDALIGVSITGMQDHPEIALDPVWQQRAALKVIDVNDMVARAIGIMSAARATCVKPEGTGTLTLFCEATPAVGAGIHPHEARQYIRRVTADENERPFQEFLRVNPGMCEKKPDGNWVISFPIQVSDDATLLDDLRAVEFLEQVRSTQENWVLPGTTWQSAVPGLTHNVSCTVATREHEWGEVADYLWEHRDDFTAVSFLPRDVTKIYDYAPYEGVRTPEQARRFRELVAMYKPVDYTKMVEDEDGTNLSGEAACSGGACLL